MKTAISVPEATARRVDEAAARLGLSRSAFYARAAERLLHEYDDDAITAAIDEAISAVGADAAVDHELSAVGLRTGWSEPAE